MNLSLTYSLLFFETVPGTLTFFVPFKVGALFENIRILIEIFFTIRYSIFEKYYSIFGIRYSKIFSEYHP